MKKIYKITTFLLSFIFLLTACGKEKGSDYKDYINEISPIFEKIAQMDTKISDIDANNQDSFEQLLSYIDELAVLYKDLSQIDPPEEFARTKSLSEESYDYLLQAKEYLKDAFKDNEINETRLENGIECYNRANKRLHYIIKILHNELIEE